MKRDRIATPWNPGCGQFQRRHRSRRNSLCTVIHGRGALPGALALMHTPKVDPSGEPGSTSRGAISVSLEGRR
jgi:hypothetical protein